MGYKLVLGNKQMLSIDTFKALGGLWLSLSLSNDQHNREHLCILDTLVGTPC